MAGFIPVFLAFAAHYCGFYIVRLPEFCPNSPPIIEALFVLGTFTFISKLNLYPSSYRKVHWLPTMIFEYTVSKALQEMIMYYTCCPLDNFLYLGLEKWFQYFSRVLYRNAYTSEDLYTKYGSYSISTMLCYLAAFMYVSTIFQAVGTYPDFNINLNMSGLYKRWANGVRDYANSRMEKFPQVFHPSTIDIALDPMDTNDSDTSLTEENTWINTESQTDCDIPS